MIDDVDEQLEVDELESFREPLQSAVASLGRCRVHGKGWGEGSHHTPHAGNGTVCGADPHVEQSRVDYLSVGLHSSQMAVLGNLDACRVFSVLSLLFPPQLLASI